MHTVEMLEQALDLARQLGYTVRQESFVGAGGGCCEVKGRKFLFLDLDLYPRERLEQALTAIRREPDAEKLPMPEKLRTLVKGEGLVPDGINVR